MFRSAPTAAANSNPTSKRFACYYEPETPMIKKTYSKTGKHCRVTFKIAPGAEAQSAAICGDFNNWDQCSKLMRKTTTGAFFITCSLPAGQSYRFRYLIDGQHWQNDDMADGYVMNEHGSSDCIVTI